MTPQAVLFALLAALPSRADEPKTPTPPVPFAPVPADSYRIVKNVPYVAGGTSRQKLDLYLPNRSATDPIPPLVVWIHGGGWEHGSKDGIVGPFPYVAKGFAVASINYRLTGAAPFPAQIHDCKAAIRFLRAHANEYSYDGTRIGVWGVSAGGHLAALLGTSGGVAELEGDGGNAGVSSRVQAVCDWFGPTDLLTWVKPTDPAGFLNRNSPLSRLMGGPVLEKEVVAMQANPIAQLKGKDAPPFLIMHGDRDPLVPLAQSELLNDALKKAGVDTTFRVVKGGGHGTGFLTGEISEQVQGFFRKQLKVERATVGAE